MATFRIELDDGSTLRVTANDEAEARSIAEAQIANPIRKAADAVVGKAADAARAVGTGVKNIADNASLVGMIDSAVQGVRGPGDAIAGKFGHKPLKEGEWSEEDQFLADLAQRRQFEAANGLAGVVTTGNVAGRIPGRPRGGPEPEATVSPAAAAPEPVAPQPSPAPAMPPAGGGAAGRVVDGLGGNEAVAGMVGKVTPWWLGGRLTGEALAKRVLDKVNPANAHAPPPQTSVPVTKQPPRQMPWGGEMPTDPVPSVPSVALPPTPEALLARLNKMDARLIDRHKDAVAASPEPQVSTDVVKRAMMEMRTRNRSDRIRPLPGARRDVPMDPAMLQALIARSKASAPAPAPTPPPAPMPPAPAMPTITDDLSIPDFLRRTPQAAPPPQAAAPMPPPAPMPQAVPPAPVAAAIPEDLSIPDFLRRNPATITKKDGKVEAKMEPQAQAAPALTKPTQKADYDRGEVLRKERADAADTFNTMKVEAGDDLYLPAHSAARNGRTPAEAAQHIADQWKLEGKPFGADEASFVSRLTKLMTPKFELADDLAKATGADKGVLREHLIGPLDADSARQFRTDLRLSFPSASRRIDEVMSDDRIVGTWPKYTQKGGKPKTPAAARKKPTKKGSGASTAG